MAALVCDICGGKLIMGSGGIATCDSCGMEHSQDRMKEKIQEIKGTVKVDNSHMIDSWMKMGNSAAEAGNHKEAYDYFTKVVEIEPNNWRAIYEKGKAGAWQSTLANLRTPEIYQGITTALEIINNSEMTPEEVINIKNEFAVALFNINNAITDLMEQNLFDLDDKYFDSHWDQMWETRQRHITNVSQMEDALTLIADLEDDLSKSNVIEFKKRMCNDLRSACASIQYWTDYSQESLGYLGFTPQEKKQYLDKYWSLVDEIRVVEENFAKDKWCYPDPFGPGFHNSDEIYNYWRKIENEREEKRKKAAAKKRFDDYWKEHSEEKKQHQSRIAEIDEKVKKLHDSIVPQEKSIKDLEQEKKNQVPAEAELKPICDNIAELQNQKKQLGLFQGKQKKVLQEQIDGLNDKMKTIELTVKRQRDELCGNIDLKISNIRADIQPIFSQIETLEKEKTSIINELNKPR